MGYVFGMETCEEHALIGPCPSTRLNEVISLTHGDFTTVIASFDSYRFTFICNI